MVHRIVSLLITRMQILGYTGTNKTCKVSRTNKACIVSGTMKACIARERIKHCILTASNHTSAVSFKGRGVEVVAAFFHSARTACRRALRVGTLRAGTGWDSGAGAVENKCKHSLADVGWRFSRFTLAVPWPPTGDASSMLYRPVSISKDCTVAFKPLKAGLFESPWMVTSVPATSSSFPAGSSGFPFDGFGRSRLSTGTTFAFSERELNDSARRHCLNIL